MAKFVLGWGSHLYYWVYPGAMAATIGIMIGYIFGIFFPASLNSATPGPVFMALVAIIAAFGISYIAYSGVQASTVTSSTINAIQITALRIFTALAITVSDIPRVPWEWRSTAPTKFFITPLPATLQRIPAAGR
jgi:amino acid transporter